MIEKNLDLELHPIGLIYARDGATGVRHVQKDMIGGITITCHDWNPLARAELQQAVGSSRLRCIAYMKCK